MWRFYAIHAGEVWYRQHRRAILPGSSDHNHAAQQIRPPLGFQGRAAQWLIQVMLIRDLDVVNQRPVAQGKQIGIGFDARVGGHALGFHGELEFDHVARVPAARDHGIALFDMNRHRMAIHG